MEVSEEDGEWNIRRTTTVFYRMIKLRYLVLTFIFIIIIISIIIIFIIIDVIIINIIITINIINDDSSSSSNFPSRCSLIVFTIPEQ